MKTSISFLGKSFFLLTLSLVFIASQCANQESISVDYSSAFAKIQVTDGKISHTKLIHHYPEDQPMVATPDSISTQQMMKDVVLSKEQVGKLKQTVEESGFMELNDTYGAPEEQRYYPYNLKVKIGEREKEVLFPSTPSFESEPEAFKKVKEFLFSLSGE